jgi:hypothetical protein
MQGDRFVSIDSLRDLGEIICCIYIYIEYDTTKAIQYMKWKGLRYDLMYRCGRCLIFYQDEDYVPDLDAVDKFYREVDEKDIWSKFDGMNYNYKYRVLSRGVVCISYVTMHEKND